MMTEGVGEIAPAAWKVVLDDHSLQVLKLEAELRAEYRGYQKRDSEWARGLQGDVVIHGVGSLRREVRPIFVGLIGEYACCSLINRKVPSAGVSVDLLRKKRGDYGIDITAFGMHMQVKTRQTAEHGNLIRVVDEYGNRQRLSARAFLFCEWSGDKTCSVLGWQWTKYIKELPIQDAVGGRKHKNVCVADWRLLCVGRLISALNAKKDLSSC